MCLIAGLTVLASTSAAAESPDTTQPNFANLEFAPSAIDVSAGPQNMRATVQLSDDLSGVNFGQIKLRSPGGQVRWGNFVSQTLDSGDILDGVYHADITIPQYSDAGEWRIDFLVVVDLAGNQRYATPEELAALPVLEVLLCTDTAPTLSINTIRTYWFSYAEYSTGLLSIDYSVTNASDGVSALDVNVVGSNSTNGVTLAGILPQTIGEIAAGGSTSLTLRYNIPASTRVFRTTTYAIAKNGCGNNFCYPSPWPGP